MDPSYQKNANTLDFHDKKKCFYFDSFCRSNFLGIKKSVPEAEWIFIKKNFFFRKFGGSYDRLRV